MLSSRADAGCATGGCMPCAGIRACCFFAGLYVCLHFAVGLPTSHTLLYIALNLLLAVREDGTFFPKVLEGYDEYKTRVPFIIPTIESLRNTFRR